jgi:hypothetical protein
MARVSIGSAHHEEMKYVYCDHSAEVASAPVTDRTSLFFRSTSAENEESDMKFPAKLYEILSKDKYIHIISWLPHGRSFKIWNNSLLEEEVMPHFFDSANYKSFVRLLNAWTFRRIKRSSKNAKNNIEDVNSYYHELFLRGMPHLLARMKRLPKKMRKLPIDNSAQPDFSKSPELPLQCESPYATKSPSIEAEQYLHSAVNNPLLGGQRGLLETHHPHLGMDPQHHSVGSSSNLLMLQGAASSAAVMEARERNRTAANAVIQQLLAAMQYKQPLQRGHSLDPSQSAMPMSTQEQITRASVGLDPMALSFTPVAPHVPSSLGMSSTRESGSDIRIEGYNSSSVGSAHHEEMKYVYCDHSTDSASAPVTDRTSLLFRSTSAENEESDMKFPAKLYEILSRDKYIHIISWLPHGRSFKIWNNSLLEEEVMPHFFDSANYKSFVRLLNAWTFRRIKRSSKNAKNNIEDVNSYYHELFLRGMPHLLARMKRLPKKMRKLPIDKSAQPDFSKSF